MTRANRLAGAGHEFEDKWRVQSHPYLAMRIRRPKVARGKPRIDLRLVVGKKKSYTVLLTEESVPSTKHRHQRKYISLPEPIRWKRGKWTTVLLDLREVFADEITKDEFEELKIEGLDLHVYGEQESQTVDFASLFVFSPWREDDRVEFDAYDASGIEGITWERRGDAPSMGFSPAVRRKKRPGIWTVVRAIDKAGNQSVPIYIPCINPRTL